MHYDAGDDSRLSKLHSFLFGGGEADDDGQTYPTGHHCFFRALAEAALDIITVVDEFGTFVSALVEKHRLQPDELIRRNLFEFVHPTTSPVRRCSTSAAGTTRRQRGREPAPAHRRALAHVRIGRPVSVRRRRRRICIVHSRDVGPQAAGGR
jgi:hypothetical protein